MSFIPLSLQGMSVGKPQAAASTFGFCCRGCVLQEPLEPSGEGHLAKGCRNCRSCSQAPCTPAAQSWWLLALPVCTGSAWGAESLTRTWVLLSLSAHRFLLCLVRGTRVITRVFYGNEQQRGAVLQPK